VRVHSRRLEVFLIRVSLLKTRHMIMLVLRISVEEELFKISPDVFPNVRQAKLMLILLVSSSTRLFVATHSRDSKRFCKACFGMDVSKLVL
jgi:hypothetical protein